MIKIGRQYKKHNTTCLVFRHQIFKYMAASSANTGVGDNVFLHDLQFSVQSKRLFILPTTLVNMRKRCGKFFN